MLCIYEFFSLNVLVSPSEEHPSTVPLPAVYTNEGEAAVGSDAEERYLGREHHEHRLNTDHRPVIMLSSKMDVAPTLSLFTINVLTR